MTTSIDGPPRHHGETHAAAGTDPVPGPSLNAVRLFGREGTAGPAQEITLSNSLIMTGTELSVRSGIVNYTYNNALVEPPAAGQVRANAAFPWTAATKNLAAVRVRRRAGFVLGHHADCGGRHDPAPR